MKKCKSGKHEWCYAEDSSHRNTIRVCRKCPAKQRQVIGKSGPPAKCWVTIGV